MIEFEEDSYVKVCAISDDFKRRLIQILEDRFPHQNIVVHKVFFYYDHIFVSNNIHSIDIEYNQL